MKVFFTISLVFCLSYFSFGQATCGATAVTLTPGSSQCGTNSNVGSFPDNGSAPTNPCNSSYNDGEYWFKFVGTGQALQLNVTGLTATYSGLFVLNACPASSPTCIASYTSGSSTANFSLTTPLLTVGVTYYFVMANWSTPYQTNFCINSTLISAPANDLCTNATTLACGTSALAGTTVGTSNLASGTGCTMSTYGVWYTFVGDGQSTTISSTGTGGFDHEMAIVSGSCGSLTNISCQDGAGSNGTETYTFTSTSGVTYYVYIGYYGSGTTTGTFTISRTCTAPPTPPANDLCANATALPCGTTNLAGTTVNTTNVANVSGCSMSNYGVWYSFVGDGNITTISTNPAFDIKLAVSTGTCGSLTNIACTDASPETATFTATLGVTYYVYIAHYSSSSSTTGTFTISRTCTAPITNDNCGSPVVVSVNTGMTCTLTTPGSLVGATASSNPNACGGTSDDDVWFSFVATRTTHYIDLLNIAGSTTDLVHVVYSGTCAGTLTQLVCSDPNSSTLTGLTVGQTYFIRVYSYTSTSGQTSTFDVCIKSDPPPVTSCSGNFYDSGGAGGNYSNNEYYTQTYCSNVGGQCVRFTFSAFSTESGYDYLSIYDGSDISAPLIGSYSGTTLNGQTISSSSGCLTIVWDSDGSTTGTGWAANVSCAACPTCSDGIKNGQEVGIDCGGPSCPACPCASLPVINDESCCATTLTVNPNQLCGSVTAGTVLNATASYNTNTCFGNDDDDVWYKFVATSTTHEIKLLNIAGSVTDMYFAVYAGTCNATGSSILCSDPNTATISALTIGNTYYIRVYTYTSTGGQNTTFNVCVGTPPPTGPCGNPANNDYCSNPALLTQGGGGWSSSTAGTYTTDTPANFASVFCGSTDNNSWYQFTASATTEVFNFTSITGCTDGIQAQVYNVTRNGSGCCTNFTSVSNCWNPWNTSPGTVTATGLTIGQTYILMVDGWAGANCNFTVSGWSASGILPVTLVNFDGFAELHGNRLIWTTQTETNNDYFIIQKSSNSKDFIDVGVVDGQGNSNIINNYSFMDKSSSPEISYYRLKQMDFDGRFEYSKIITISSKKNVEVSIYPNPTSGNLFFDITGNDNQLVTIIYSDVIGAVHKEVIQTIEGKNTYQTTEFTKLNSGIYFIQMLNSNNEVIKHQKIVKK